MTLEEWGLTFYCLTGSSSRSRPSVVSYFFWEALFGGLVEGLWSGGLGSRPLLILLVLFLAGPADPRSVRPRAHSVRRLRAHGAAGAFRLETCWRVEAAELIDALPGVRRSSGGYPLRPGRQGDQLVGLPPGSADLPPG